MIPAVLHNLRIRTLRTSLTAGGIDRPSRSSSSARSPNGRKRSWDAPLALNTNQIFAIGAGFDRDGSATAADGLNRAAVIRALGASVGISLRALIVTFVNARNAAVGNLELFAPSRRLVAVSFAFAVVLSVVAGLDPALTAARLDPTEALRRSA